MNSHVLSSVRIGRPFYQPMLRSLFREKNKSISSFLEEKKSKSGNRARAQNRIRTQLLVVHGLEVRVGLVADRVVDGLLHGLVLLEADLRVPADHGANAAGFRAHGGPASGPAERKHVLKKK